MRKITLMVLMAISIIFTNIIAQNMVLSLDGNEDYIQTTNAPEFVTQTITLEAWINITDASIINQYATLIHKGNSWNYQHNYDIRIYNYTVGWKVMLAWQNQSNTDQWSYIRSDTISFLENSWYHLAITKSSTLGECKIYINGEDLTDLNSPQDPTLPFNTDNNHPLLIGADYYGYAQRYFPGKIDEVRIWNIVRTQPEILSDINSTLVGTEVGLVGYWNFNDSTANDITPNGNNGVLIGDAFIIPEEIPALNEIPITVSIDSLDANKGSLIAVGINVAFPPDSTFSSAELSFSGFQGSLEFVEIDTINSMMGSTDWDISVNETDTLLITASGGSDDISNEGILFWLKFIIPDTCNTGFIPIILEHALFNETTLTIEIQNGGVNVLESIVYGDVSLNGEVHAYDASLILKYLIGIEDLNNQQLLNANVSLDTTISALDASLIFQYVVSLIDVLPYDTSMGELHASGNIGMNDYEIQVGQQIDVPLFLSNGENILSFEGTLNFNPEHLTYNGIIWSGLLNEFTIELNEENGEITVAGAGSVPDGQENVFGTFQFTVNENFDEYQTTVSLTNLRWNEEVVLENVASSILIKTLSIDENNSIPNKFGLNQNYPNPFNPVTTISYQLSKSTMVNLSVYNIAGQLVETLVNERKNAGFYSVQWNAGNVGSGLFFYRIEAGEYSAVKKCLILK